MTTTRRSSRRLLALAAVPLLVLGLAACSPGGGEAAPEVKSDSQVAADATRWDVAHAGCLRDQGIDVEDPSDDGFRAGFPADVDLDTLNAALGTCDEKVTADLGPRPVTASEEKADEERDAAVRETAECLRGKGYDVADPTEGGSGIGNGTADVPADVLEACGGASGDGSGTVQR